MPRLKAYLFQRYPLEENIWKIIIPISLFIGLFMLIFQPFGLDELQASNKYMILSGYGLVTFLVLVFNLLLIPSLFPVLFKEENWIVLKEIIFLLWILFTVGLGNLVYSSWIFGFRLGFTNAILFQIYTLAIGFIPITALTLVKQNYLQRKNQENAVTITSSLHNRKAVAGADRLLQISSDNEKDTLTVNPDDVLFIRSEGNYITVSYLKNGRYARALLCNTMKYATDQLSPFTFFYQCHRSWIINLNRITGISGNSQGLRLRMEAYDEEIPVARNNASAFKRIMTENEV